jgi:hypothetical protein
LTGDRTPAPPAETPAVKPQNPKTLAALAGAAIAAALFVSFRPAARAEHRPATWDPGEVPAWADPDDAERYEELEAHHQAVVARLSERCALVEAMVRGDRTLADVAARFRELNAESPNAFGDLRRKYPNAGADELAHRQVIRFVRNRADGRSAAYANALPRFEAEFTSHFGQPAGD